MQMVGIKTMYYLIKTEVFKPIEGYENLYEISNFGRVKSLSKLIGRRIKPETFLKIRITPHGYEMVTLCKNGKPFNASVHRLIAKAFIENPLNKPCINHIDGNKLNNDISNLEWCTYRENNIHAYRTGLDDPMKHGRTGKRRPLTEQEKQLISIRTKEAMQRPEVQEKLHKSRGKKVI